MRKSGPEIPSASSVSRRQALGALALFPALAGCAALLRGDEPTEAEVLYGKLMCNCGCNQILGECNHIGCPNSVPMRAEVDRYLAGGLSPEETLAMFVDKYGTGILSAPSGEGWFNLSAWVMPFAGLLAGAAGVAYYVRRMLRRGAGAAPQATVPAAGIEERLEHELSDFTPED